MMPGGPARVVAVVRHREAVLGCPDSGSALSIAFPNRPVDGEPPETAVETLLDELGFDEPVVERRGAPIESSAGELVPFLVSVDDRTVTESERCADPTWRPPAEFGSGADVSWRTYSAVAPTVETIRTDTERGSTAIATDALWVLRDAATRARRAADGLGPVESVANDLLAARPSMAALANRVHRAMAHAEKPADVESATTEGIDRAVGADEEAAALAAETVAGSRVLTLSRSGTVRAALIEAGPEVVVLASLPGGEGHAVADELADAGVDIATCPDADVYERLRSGDVDAVLVGADAVTPAGGVVNKVGTRAAALAAEAAGIPFYAACASDKIRQSPTAGDDTEAASFDPMFDLTPPRLVTAVFTERGRLAPDAVSAIADEHRERTRWRP